MRVITMQREAKRIAVNRQLAHAPNAAPYTLDDDAALHVGVPTGGTRVFCACSDPSDRFGARSS
jgi:enoyl-CoA hydratase/carnithine racemase